MYCDKCGSEMSIDQVYCGHCGSKNRLGASTFYAREFRNGNKDSFRDLYDESYQTVLNGIGDLLGNDPEAIEDCVQLVYMKVYTKIDQYNPEKSFPKWVYTIAKNTAIDELRKKGKKAEYKEIPLNYTDDEDEKELNLVSDYKDFNPTFDIDQSEKDDIIRSVMESLPEASKECIRLMYVEGLHIKDISEILDTKEANIKKRLSYGRKLVKEKILEYESNGLKLYNVAPFTFFIWLLRVATVEDAKRYAALGANICEGISRSVEIGVSYAAKEATKEASKAATKEVTKKAAKKAAKSTTKKVVKASVAKKVTAIVASVVIGGGAAAGIGVGVGKYVWENKQQEEDLIIEKENERLTALVEKEKAEIEKEKREKEEREKEEREKEEEIKTNGAETRKEEARQPAQENKVQTPDKTGLTEEDINSFKDFLGISRDWPVRVECGEPYFREGIGRDLYPIAVYTEEGALLGLADIEIIDGGYMSVYTDPVAIEAFKQQME